METMLSRVSGTMTCDAPVRLTHSTGQLSQAEQVGVKGTRPILQDSNTLLSRSISPVVQNIPPNHRLFKGKGLACNEVPIQMSVAQAQYIASHAQISKTQIEQDALT